MSLFSVDPNALKTELVPLELRKSYFLKFVDALLSPLFALIALFNTNRAQNLYRLAHGPQVVHIEAVLNDVFDNTLRRIRIVRPAEIESAYIYRSAESKPLYLYRRSENKPVYIRRTQETIGGGPDFIVQVPALLVFDPVYMRALVTEYCLPSKTFTIQLV